MGSIPRYEENFDGHKYMNREELEPYRIKYSNGVVKYLDGIFSGKGMKMKVQKYEIARVIDKLKSIVQKNDQFPALGGILVKDGYLIASNSEITMKVKLEASAGRLVLLFQ